MWINRILLTLCLIVGICNLVSKDNNVIEGTNEIDSKTNNALTMMLETDVDSNQYEISSSNKWPTEGYIFNTEISACERGSELIWNEETKTVNLKTSTSDKCYVYFDKEPEVTYLADYIKNTVYTGVDGENGLYYHDGVGTYTNADQEAGDYSYRYAGADPNNYVCFGSDAETCPEDNLYRIIGVFEDQVKLIKNTRIGGQFWSGSLEIGNNEWSNSTLNTGTLNGTYLNGFGTRWSNMISTTDWKVGGMTGSNGYEANVKTAYNYELGSNSSNTIYSAKIGLMYVSDYGYAASPSAWTINLGIYNNYTNTSKSWLNLGADDEWTISRMSDNTYNAFLVGYYGIFAFRVYLGTGGGAGVDNDFGVHPTFYLQPFAEISRGDGTKENPFRLSAQNLIQFTISSLRISEYAGTFYAEKGMTWGEWVNSIYNTAGYQISSTGKIVNSEGIGVYFDYILLPDEEGMYGTVSCDNVALEDSVIEEYGLYRDECSSGAGGGPGQD